MSDDNMPVKPAGRAAGAGRQHPGARSPPATAATTARSRSRSPTRACRRTPGVPPTSTRPLEKRAERQVSLLFALSSLCTIGFVVAYFAIDIGDNWETVGGLGASTVALGLILGVAHAAHRRRHHPVGPQAHGRPRDRRDAAPGPLLRRGPRGDARQPQARCSTSPASRKRPMMRRSLLRRGRPARRPRRHRAARPRPHPEPGRGRGRRHGPQAHAVRRHRRRARQPPYGRARPRRRRHPDPRHRPRDRRPGQRRPRRDLRPRGRRAPGRQVQGRGDPGQDGARTRSSTSTAGRTGPSTASSATRRSAPTSGARSPCTSAPRTTCCARATSRPSTSPTAPRWCSDRPPGRCRSCHSGEDDEGYLVAKEDFDEPVGASFWERDSDK